MSFDVFKPPGRIAKRTEEMKKMFDILADSPTSCGRVDLEPANVYYYAKKLGYKVYVQNEYNGYSKVWVTGKIAPHSRKRG